MVDGAGRMGFAGSIAIGRDTSNDLVLPFPEVSSRHAVIEWREGSWRVRDLGSRNGTTVNGRRITTWRAIRVGDTLRFGGRPWRATALGEPLPGERNSVLARTAAKQQRLTQQLRLTLARDGSDAGIIRLEAGESCWVTRSGQPFLLLDRLAWTPGEWVDDSELKSMLWGRLAHRVSRSALHTIIHNTRRIFEGWGLEGQLIEKQRGKTRLTLPPERVRRKEE